MFATRAHDALEQRVADALDESGRQIALHGWTGVGKTSLMDHICDSRGIEYLPVECAGTYEAMMHGALSDLEVLAAKGVVEKRGRSSELQGGAAPFFSGRLRRSGDSEKYFEPYGAPLENLVVDALVEAGVRVMFIDNLEDLAEGDDERRGICRLIKMCSARSRSHGATAPKVVVAGPTGAIGELLLLDDAADRRTAQIEVPRMPGDEIEQILVRGEAKLDLVFDLACRKEIVVHADGFPYYAHLYALHCSLATTRDGRDTVLVEDFYAGLDEIIESCSSTLREAYSRAIRGRGQPALRRGALAALAAPEEVEVSMQEVQRTFVELHPHYERVERVRFIGKLLKEFQEEFGILEPAWRQDGTPAFRFRDPLMRVYIRLRTLRDRRAETARWRSSLPLSDGGR
jgi:hypothetical protein